MRRRVFYIVVDERVLRCGSAVVLVSAATSVPRRSASIARMRAGCGPYSLSSAASKSVEVGPAVGGGRPSVVGPTVGGIMLAAFEVDGVNCSSRWSIVARVALTWLVIAVPRLC